METEKIGTTSLTQEQKDQWLFALRSGTYKQGKDKLCSLDRKFCCLGVLCDVMKIPCKQYDDYRMKYVFDDGDRLNYLPTSMIIKSVQSVLSEMNDTGKDFPTIADWIEKHVQVTP